MGLTVWYEPPPGGPRTHLNRGGYYVESARTPAIIQKLSKARQTTVILPVVAAIAAFCYVPLSKYRSSYCLKVFPFSWSWMSSLLTIIIITLNYYNTELTVGQKGLPHTMNPEHVAAQRAYMRYHNMNPIFGISSKRARAADPDP